MARKIKSSYVDAIVSSNSDSFELIILPGKFDVMPGRVLFQGKVVDVKREVSKIHLDFGDNFIYNSGSLSCCSMVIKYFFSIR